MLNFGVEMVQLMLFDALLKNSGVCDIKWLEWVFNALIFNDLLLKTRPYYRGKKAITISFGQQRLLKMIITPPIQALIAI